MAIVTPDDIQVTPDHELLVPPMDSQPLQRALENTNYLYKWHRPPLVDCCPNVASGQTRHQIVVPITPSADGLRYTFRYIILPDSGHQCQTTVYYTTAYAGGGTVWTQIYTVTATQPGPFVTAWDLLLQETDADQTIPANAVALLFDFQLVVPNVGSVTPGHILVYPSPAAPSAGKKASGFYPFDDGLLVGTAGAAVHTEFLNRSKSNVLNVLRDRRQMCLSFVQKEQGTPKTVRAGSAGTGWQSLPVARVWFPFQGPTVQVSLKVLADVTGGSTASPLVQVRQVGVPDADVCQFLADGAINADTLQVYLQGEGLMKYADFEISAKTTAAGNDTRIRAICGWWRPTE